jgi:hypothetical protein
MSWDSTQLRRNPKDDAMDEWLKAIPVRKYKKRYERRITQKPFKERKKRAVCTYRCSRTPFRFMEILQLHLQGR